jgi:hypothetical protein
VREPALRCQEAVDAYVDEGCVPVADTVLAVMARDGALAVCAPLMPEIVIVVPVCVRMHVHLYV